MIRNSDDSESGANNSTIIEKLFLPLSLSLPLPEQKKL